MRAVNETAQRLALASFLPAESMSLAFDGVDGDLQRGLRQIASALVVHLRDSTAISESSTPPGVLTAFIGEFRSRVTAPAREHGGMTDRFVGDGAPILFGAPAPTATGAMRAVACAEALLAEVQARSPVRLQRGAEPIEIGIGLHHGPVFFGAPSRLQPVKLGDTDNVVAGFEKVTRAYARQALISGGWLDAARIGPSDRRPGRLGPTGPRGSSPTLEGRVHKRPVPVEHAERHRARQVP